MEYCPSHTALSLALVWTGPFMSEADRGTFSAEIAGRPWPELELRPAGNEKDENALLERDTTDAWLCSRRAPNDEAERQLAAWTAEQQPVWTGTIVVLGFGGPWLLRALRRRLQSGGKVLLVDPQPEWLAAIGAAFLQNPFDGWSPEQLTILTGSDPVALLARFRQTIADYPVLSDWRFLATPFRQRRARELFAGLAAAIIRGLKAESANRVTVGMYAQLWFRNAVENLPVLETESPIDPLLNVLPGKTALVVAAGPTLDRSLPALKKLASQVAVVAAGAAVPCLKRHGITPHLVVAVDSDPVIARQVAGAETETWCLAAPLTVDSQLFASCRGRTFFFTADLVPGLNVWLKSLRLLPAYLRIGGTVAVTALDLAVRLGCTRIILAGIDLAFEDRAGTHADGAIFGGMSRLPSGLIDVPGNFAPTVKTTPQFAGYIDILADYERELRRNHPAVQLVNATDGGARLGGIPAVSAEKVAAKDWPEIDFDLSNYILSRRGNVMTPSVAGNWRDARREAAVQFRRMAETAAEGEMIFERSGGTLSDADLAALQELDRRRTEYPLAMQLSAQMLRALSQGLVGHHSWAGHRNWYLQLKESARWAAARLDRHEK